MHVSSPSDARSSRRRLARSAACAVLALASAGVAAAGASAATIGVTAPCVVNISSGGAQMQVVGNGFAAGDSIELTTNSGGGFGMATADATGAFSTLITAPTLSNNGPGEATFTLTAIDETTSLLANPTTTFLLANLAVATKPMEAKPSKKVTFTFSGFLPGTEIYAHYLHGKKVTATARFGRAVAPCGLLKTKAKLYPGKRKFQTYKVQFDDSRHYSAKTLPRWVSTLSIFTF